MSPTEVFRTLYVDPGETTGWCVGRGSKLLAGGQERMWAFFDAVYNSLETGGSDSFLDGDEYLREGVEDDNMGQFGRIVCEDWRLYPSHLKSLAWDQCRTARLIGGLTGLARIHQIPLVLQPAAIKPAAEAAGAKELYWKPQHENRHQNDAVQHFVFFTQTELMGMPSKVNLETLPGAPSAIDE